MQATEIYKKQNLENRVAFSARPVLLVVDFVKRLRDFVDCIRQRHSVTEIASILASTRWPSNF